MNQENMTPEEKVALKREQMAAAREARDNNKTEWKLQHVPMMKIISSWKDNGKITEEEYNSVHILCKKELLGGSGKAPHFVKNSNDEVIILRDGSKYTSSEYENQAWGVITDDESKIGVKGYIVNPKTSSQSTSGYSNMLNELNIDAEKEAKDKKAELEAKQKEIGQKAFQMGVSDEERQQMHQEWTSISEELNNLTPDYIPYEGVSKEEAIELAKQMGHTIAS